jgi:ppGpp synthetase/RelA/SpoT-type nucleotidyltranferase
MDYKEEGTKMTELSISEIEKSLYIFRIGRSLILKKILEVISINNQLNEKFLIMARLFCRLKSADSILEKINRKKLEINDVLELPQKMQDILGFRIITSNMYELKIIDQLLLNEFELINKIDRIKEPGIDGEREINYELIYSVDGKSYPFEIQLRTFLQHYFSIPTFHLFHKRQPETRIRYRKDLNEFSEHLMKLENYLEIFDKVIDENVENSVDTDRLSIISKVHLIVFKQRDEKFSDSITINLSGDYEKDNELIVDRKVDLYKAHPNSTIVECSCMDFSSYILNEPHINVPVHNWHKI